MVQGAPKRCKDRWGGAGAKLHKKGAMLLIKWCGAGARLLKKVQSCKKRCKIATKKKVIEKVVWCRCKVTRPERVKWQWVKSGERHSTVGSGDTREEKEAKITTRKRNSTSTSSTNY